MLVVDVSGWGLKLLLLLVTLCQCGGLLGDGWRVEVGRGSRVLVSQDNELHPPSGQL